MKVVINKYDPNWEVEFQLEHEKIFTLLSKKKVFIEHIGSTSVEGLGAKPIIDIMIGLNDFNIADSCIKDIESLDYEYISKHESIMPNRRFFIKNKEEKLKYHIHMVGYQTDFWKRHLAFRNHLINNKKDREEYFNLKIELAKREWKDGGEYANAKSEFISKIEEKINTRSHFGERR